MIDKVPVTLLTGYLGAGKTTLVNHIVATTSGARYAVIVNELAEIGIDADLIVRQDQDVVELSNGCICCSVRHELAPALVRLARTGAYDAILIETTGMASSRPIMASLASDHEVRAVARLNSVIAVVDARTLEQRLDDSLEAREQIRFADRILLNKIDLVDQETQLTASARLRALNPIAAIHPTHRSNIAADMVMAQQAGELDTLDGAEAAHDHACGPDCEHEHGHPHPQGGGDTHQPDGISSVSLTMDRPLDAMKLTHWLDRLLLESGPDILRAKGILDVQDEPRRIVVQVVAGLLDGEARAPWDADAPRVSRLIFIGRRLNAAALKSGFEATAFVAPSS